MSTFFRLHNAEVRRAGRTILSIDDFSLGLGEHIALLGPNGSGKSTFVRLITREILPLFRDDPCVYFRDNPRATREEVRSNVGIVSSSMQDEITVHLPVIEIVVGGLYATLGLPRHAEVTEGDLCRAHEMLELLGVDDLADRDVMTLSTGQARRVLIARSCVHRPPMMILDEPVNGLDPEGMFYVRKSMRAMAQAGCTIVLVTHYPEDIIPEIQRVAMLRNGRMFADGPKQELLTSRAMTELFGVPLEVTRKGEYFSLVSAY